MIVGSSIESRVVPAYMSPAQQLQAQNQDYLNLIRSYEDLSELYVYQGENLRVMMDSNILDENPQEFYEAVSSMKDYRDKILVQMGRILELRKAANLKNGPTTSAK